MRQRFWFIERQILRRKAPGTFFNAKHRAPPSAPSTGAIAGLLTLFTNGSYVPFQRVFRLQESVTFVKEFLKHPTKVGAIAPSSPGLVDAMVDWFDWDSIRNVVEFGPGTGVFTEGVLKKLHPEATFFAIERSAEMVAVARKRCPKARVFEDSATNLPALCDHMGIGKIDAVICGLPWASFPETLQAEIMETMIGRMAPGGKFATFAYWQGVVLPAGRRFSRRLRASFESVERSHTVWRNLPPAFVYRCKLTQ